MPFKRFVGLYVTQVMANALIGASIIFLCWNWAILPIAGVSIPHFSFLQCIGIYFLIGVIRGDYKCYIK
jgi:hypothetical protein|tara:strand:- start:1708 stop:1914 length:207 start_codon:yes stop_codon:yes gene_type:complete